MSNCRNCSAPLPSSSITCDYCGSRNDLDLSGVHYFTTTLPDSERTCPRCSQPLATIDLNLNGSFLIERCDTCLGLFFDNGEVESLLDATVKNVYGIDSLQLRAISNAKRHDDYPVSYIKCPVCGRVMNRINFGAKSGVVVDRCKEHGLWLDGGELRQLLEWTKAGGRILDGEKSEERKREEDARLRDQRAEQGMPVTPATEGESDLFDALLRNQEPDIFGKISKFMAFLTRQI